MAKFLLIPIGLFISVLFAMVTFASYPFIIQSPIVALSIFLAITFVVTPSAATVNSTNTNTSAWSMKDTTGKFLIRWTLTTFGVLVMIAVGLTIPSAINGLF